jgi:hypothetical protein
MSVRCPRSVAKQQNVEWPGKRVKYKYNAWRTKRKTRGLGKWKRGKDIIYIGGNAIDCEVERCRSVPKWQKRPNYSEKPFVALEFKPCSSAVRCKKRSAHITTAIDWAEIVLKSCSRPKTQDAHIRVLLPRAQPQTIKVWIGQMRITT